MNVSNVRKIELKKLSPEALLEGFVTEAKLSDPEMPMTTVAELDEHGAQWRAYAAEIVARGGTTNLVQLLDSPDTWIAYCVADILADREETKDRALASLERIADAGSGSASSAARIARNMILFGDPLGEPAEVEKRLAEIRARDGAR